jgi:hypothetical protein
MLNGIKKYDADDGTIDIDWEPDIDAIVVVDSIQLNLASSDSSGDSCTMKVLDSDGDTVFNFQSLNFSLSSETEFSIVPDRSITIPYGGALAIDWANSGTIELSVNITWHRAGVDIS